MFRRRSFPKLAVLGITAWVLLYWAWADYTRRRHLSTSGISLYKASYIEERFPLASLSNATPFAGLRAVALVFYGRKEYVSILDCYLQRNLKRNGGILDEVIFAVKTQNNGDLSYLEDYLLAQPDYSKFSSNKTYKGVRGKYEDMKLDWWAESKMDEFDSSYWMSSWEAVSEPDTVYIKIDDDVLFIEDGAMEAMVKRLVGNPQFFGVSANIVNGAALSWVHGRMGVHEPYWPEMNPPVQQSSKGNLGPNTANWRTSDYPYYNGPPNGPKDFIFDGSTPAPYPGHRWLRLPPDTSYNVSVTPAATFTFDAWGPSVRNWAAGAQSHYSLLHHLEQGNIGRYKFNMWDYNFQRLALNFIAFRGRDIMDAFPFPTMDDEEFLTKVRPRQLDRRVVVEGGGLVAHFAFGMQRSAHGGRGLAWTDLVSRYRGYAEEMICSTHR